MKYVTTVLLSVVALTFLAAPATADWNVGDPFKMHFPQLPDPNGWDVNFMAPKVLADDWLCTESGPVSDVHFWFSAQYDNEMIPFQIDNIHVSIHDNKPADPVIPFSRPGALLWARDFGPNEFTARFWGTGQQGWYDPNTGQWNWPDHQGIGQVNIKIPPTAAAPLFEQKRGEIYWLDLSVKAHSEQGTFPVHLGWKTSREHFMDDAVWADIPTSGEPMVWRPLTDPRVPSGEPPVSLDMAFVITPEPGTVAMLVGAGLIGLVGYARRRRMR